jgi:ABC-type glycerol-3-phosphate transport system substrate-binding protein
MDPTSTDLVVEPTLPPPLQGPLGAMIEDLNGVEVSFWHSWSEGMGAIFETLVAEFNAINEYGITVMPLYQGEQNEMRSKMQAAITTSELPNLVVGYNYQYLAWEAIGDVIFDMTPYIQDPYFGFSEAEIADFYPALWRLDDIEGERLGIPAYGAGQLYLYNFSWTQELGFNGPPTTPEEFKAQACAAAGANNSDENAENDGTGGLLLKPNASTMLQWIWAFGGEVEIPGVGYNFTTPEATEALTFLYQLFAEGCAWIPKAKVPNVEFATRQGLFHASSIDALSLQRSAFDDAENEDQWGPIPFPTTSGEPLINLSGPSIAMVGSSLDKQLASWIFIKWFSEPQTQAKWIVASPYFPTRASTLDLLQDHKTNHPLWASALEYLGYGKVEPRFESWSSVLYTVGDAATVITQQSFTADQVPQLLADLQAAVDKLHATTQE